MYMSRRLLALCLLSVFQTLVARAELRPNIVFILGDDIGYGDFGCYGATKIKTLYIDRLAQQGVRFIDAHSPSAMCRLKLAENTLVIVTSDNGGVLDPNGPDTINAGTEKTNNGHLHNGVLRGDKGNLFEGGHRVPFVARLHCII